jgi:hypothetical protein
MIDLLGGGRRLAVSVSLLLTVAAADAAPKVWQGKDSAVTEAEVEVEAQATAIYQALTDYAAWPGLFTDVMWTKVKSGGREDAVVQYKSRTFGKPQHYKFCNAQNRLVRYELIDGPSGVKLVWEARLEPGPENGTTKVRMRLHVTIDGVLGWLVSKDQVRKHRESKLRTDINDLTRRFPPPRPTSQAAARPSN